MLPGTDPVHKVTIIPRGMALGVTQQLPDEDRHSYNRTLHPQHAGHPLRRTRRRGAGAAAKSRTGAGNDIEKATELARKMVCEWGMSESLGPVMLQAPERRAVPRHGPAPRSASTPRRPRAGRQRGEAHAHQRLPARAKRSCGQHASLCTRWPTALLERETLDGRELDEILGGSRRSAAGRASDAR